MRMGTNTIAACAIVCALADVAAAQGRAMTLADVLARAREHAPAIVAARLAVDEARGRLAGASLRLPSNPQVDVAVGSRNGSGARSADVELGLGQSFEPGSRRSARIAGANAGIAQHEAAADDVTRSVLRLAAFAYYRVIHADERIRLLDAARDLSSNIYAAADRRFRAGDIAVLDVNIARASLARARAERESAEASRALALGELQQSLGLGTDIDVAGTLAPPVDVDLASALQASLLRPELRVLEAGVAEADAEARLGRSYARPDYGVSVRYAREERDRIVLGGVTLTLPLFSKGQEQRAVGTARATRLRAELDAARTRVQTEVRTAFAAFTRRLAAVRLLESDAVASLDENEQLSARSFEVGQLGLPDLLLVRREILDTRFQYLDALLEAALARIDLDASSGMLR